MYHYTQEPLPFGAGSLSGNISEKTLTIHHDKLYAGYVNKTKEIEEALVHADTAPANQVYSAYRGLKANEAFARNGVLLHESYFATMGGDGIPNTTLPLYQQIEKDFGSFEQFKAHFIATGMAVRGWAVLAWDFNDQKLHIYGCDSHEHGGIWGTIPLVTLDVYEHAYFIDFGSDRKGYIDAFLQNIHWNRCNTLFEKVSKVVF